MKITAGLGALEYLAAYATAGADEVFCGYVPEAWTQRYSQVLPMNRREVRYCNVQIGSETELRLLTAQAKDLGISVTLTLNSLYYIPEQYPLLTDNILHCRELGVSGFIIADPALLLYLHQNDLSSDIPIHVSGELGACNRHVLALCRELGATRYIFHRKVSLNDIATCINAEHNAESLSAKEASTAPGFSMTPLSPISPLSPTSPMSFEAFALNELCHFHGGFCNTLHCDVLPHMCREAYRLGGVSSALPQQVPAASTDDPQLLGGTGCGLCALWRMG